MKKELGGCSGYSKQNGRQGNIEISELAGLSTNAIHIDYGFFSFSPVNEKYNKIAAKIA